MDILLVFLPPFLLLGLKQILGQTQLLRPQGLHPTPLSLSAFAAKPPCPFSNLYPCVCVRVLPVASRLSARLWGWVYSEKVLFTPPKCQHLVPRHRMAEVMQESPGGGLAASCLAVGRFRPKASSSYSSSTSTFGRDSGWELCHAFK